MSEHSQKTPFIKASSQDQYGKIPLKSWVGKVVAYESQKEQIEEGWGWRYKVRILGDDSNSKNVADEELSYAICLLPTTAGSGAAYKLRSVRVSQGDMVYGIYGGDGPRIIIGVFPRTAQTESTSGNFGTLSGFTGSLNDTGILDGEFNGQKGPKFLKGVSGLEPGEWTKATAENPSEKVKEIAPQVKELGDGVFEEVSEEITENNDLSKKVGKVNENWKPGDNLNTATMDYLKESFEKGELSAEDYKAALKQAEEQGLDGYEEYVIEDEIKEIEKKEVKKEEIKEELKKVNKKSKAIEVLSKAYPYVDTSNIKTYADYIAEGVKITEIGPNDFTFTYPNGKQVISRRIGSSNAPTVESRFDSLAFTLQKDKQDDEIEKQKRDEEKKAREEAQRLRNIEFAKKFPNLYNPDGTRKK